MEVLIMNEQVKNLLQNSIWDVATCADNRPNVVPVGFKEVLDDGRLAFANVFLETTMKNIQANGGRVAISVYDAKTFEGYQIQGTAEYITEGKPVDDFKAMADSLFHGAVTAKGAVLVTPEKVIVTTPGADNKKVL